MTRCDGDWFLEAGKPLKRTQKPLLLPGEGGKCVEGGRAEAVDAVPHRERAEQDDEHRVRRCVPGFADILGSADTSAGRQPH
jgi:hypothetical protein